MTTAADARLMKALTDGDEAAFKTLIDTHSSSLLRVARVYVGSRAVAEEVVQETWLGVLRGVERFEGRSSLKTWIFKILTNIASTRAARERRSVPFSSLAAREAADGEAAVDPERFLPADHDRWPHHWALGPTAWQTPEEGLLSAETRELMLQAIADLPPAQQTVISLRDIEGWPSHEVCSALEISEGNQRVLLHRARAKVRNALEGYLGSVEVTIA
ncbi:MAG: sigma-70 family RNA polymerase sigma factor [Thermoleophilaceae bacterium]|nr:sigma-70 family RNA polymerase sigma factor [Thermoleophilaceae bacterium]